MTKIYEEWADVKGYEGIYEVSNTGFIRRTSAARGTTVGYVFVPCKDKKGYLRTRLTDAGGIAHTVKVHRIVCAAFNSNPENLPQVNHKDGDKSNNFASNLEWCTNLHNAHHAIAMGIKGKSMKGKFGAFHNRSICIYAKNIKTNEEKTIVGINEAARHLKTNASAIWRVLQGEWKHTKGWTFQRL